MVSLINFKTVDGELESGESVSVRVAEDSGTGESDGGQRASQQSQQLQAHTQARRTKNSIYFNEKTQVEHSNEPLGEIPNFVVTWRQLRFAIEPKWHQRLRNSTLASALARSRSGRASGKQREKGQHKTKDQSKLVLDRLDGSFRSGELTAILGPSGKFTC